MTVAVRSFTMQSPTFGNEREAGSDVEGRPFVVLPGPNDVLLGRGGGTNNHEGNIKFRNLVSIHKMRYLASTKVDKPKVARDVVGIWRKLDPPGRFLQRKDESKKGKNSIQDNSIAWIEVDDQEARKKASQCLRERTPDVKPFIEQLNKQDEAKDTRKSTGKQQHQTKSKQGVSTSPTESGSDVDSPALEKSGLLNGPQTPISSGMPDRLSSTDVNFMRSVTLPDQPMHINPNHMRRGSMPVFVHSASQGFGGMPSNAATLRLQDRRTSLPAANQLQGQQARVGDMERLMARQEQVLRDAYTAIERTGDSNASNLAGLQMQQQILSNRQLMMQQQYMKMKAQMLQQTRNGQTMPDMMQSSFVGMPQQANGQGYLPQQMNPNTQQLMQQQQMLAQQQQRLIAEQERLVRQEHILANLTAQSQQVKPASAISGQDRSSSNCVVEDELEPLPINGDVYLSLSILSDVQTTDGGSHFARLNEKLARETTSLEHNKAATSIAPDFPRSNAGFASDEQKNNAGKAAVDEKTEQAAKLSSAQQSGQRDEADPNDTLLEYRKTLETYILTNQSSIPSLDDMNDDGIEQLATTVDGVATSEWIEEQLLNDSGLHSSADLSNSKGRTGRPLQRSNSKKSLMSMGTSTDMSFAFSDMEYSLDLSTKGENCKRTANRSMSILSHNSHMSELTDYDDLETL